MNRLLTTQEVAGILRKKPDTLAKWRKQGLGPPFIWIEGTIRYDEGELKVWLKNNTYLRKGNKNEGI
jgi:hypothetical protein